MQRQQRSRIDGDGNMGKVGATCVDNHSLVVYAGHRSTVPAQSRWLNTERVGLGRLHVHVHGPGFSPRFSQSSPTQDH